MSSQEPRDDGGWLVYALVLLAMAIVLMLVPPLLTLVGVR